MGFFGLLSLIWWYDVMTTMMEIFNETYCFWETSGGWEKDAWLKTVRSNGGCKLPPREGFTTLYAIQIETLKISVTFNSFINASSPTQLTETHRGGFFVPRCGSGPAAIQRVHTDGMEGMGVTMEIARIKWWNRETSRWKNVREGRWKVV